MKNKNNYKSLIINLIIVISSSMGVIFSLMGEDNMMSNWKALLFYTVQSNIVCIIVSLIISVYLILIMFGKAKKIPNFLYILKFCSTVGITLTLLVFWIFLARLLPVSYYFSITNITLHTLSPILAIIDFLIFDKKCTVKKIYISYIEPIIYLLFCLSVSFLGITFNSSGDIVPYFFLNYKELGWLKITGKGLGVVYWIIIMLVIVHIIALTLIIINNKINKKKEGKLKNTIDYMI